MARDRTRVDVSGTGPANASGGGIAVSGYVGSVSVVHQGVVARSAYVEQVRRLAPEQLADRDKELAELASFCTEPDRGSYSWWQAGAWAGKSALMSWFVLHPPPGVRVVSFFITARLAGQSDRGAFTEVVLEQLADLLGEPMPAYLTEATRDGHLLNMLTKAVQASREKGQQLALVVDGLDEDLGWTTSLDAHSIAALLPPEPPAGTRIIVAGRPNPPVPADVPENHPLRNPQVIRPLNPSPHAAVIHHDAVREIKRLVKGTEAEQDLLGLLTAAAGGLSGPDLAELTGLPAWEIEEHLHTVSGRSFGREVSQWQPGTLPEVYLLGHPELRQLAVTHLGATRLQAYLQRLHAWAAEYRQRGWPADTPEYLLRDYYRLLGDTRDLGRLIACATDPARHDRMLDLTGGDSAALSEITTAQQAVLRQAEPDLLAMACLAIHRDTLGQRNVNVPAGLPVVWARLGRTQRAEALAGAITNLGRRAEALAGLATAAATNGDLGRAKTLAHRAEKAAGGISDADWQAWAYAVAAKAMAAAGDLERALRLARHARALADQAARSSRNGLRRVQMIAQDGAAAAAAHPYADRSWALSALVEATAAARDPRATDMLSNQADILVNSNTARQLPWEAVTALPEAVTRAEDPYTARILADWAEAVIGSITEPNWQAWRLQSRKAETLAALAKALVAAGDLDRARVTAGRAEAMVHDIGDESWQVSTESSGEAEARTVLDIDRKVDTLAAVAQALAAAGDLDGARSLAGQAATDLASWISESFRQAQTITTAAMALAAAGGLVQSENLVNSVTDPYWQVRGLIALAAAASAGDPEQARGQADRARALAGSIADPDQQARALTALAMAVATAGDLDHAQAIASSVTDPRGQAEILTVLADAAASAGDSGRAGSLAVLAQDLAGSITDHERKARTLTETAKALALTGDLDRARQLADRAEAAADAIGDARRHAWALEEAASAFAATGDIARAQAAARRITDPDSQARALTEITGIRARAGDLDQAETIARSITDEFEQAEALRTVTDAAVEAGNLDLAAAVADSIGDRIQQAWALAHVVNALVAAGDPERAETLAGRITWTPTKVGALGAVAKAMAAAGKPDRAGILFDQARELACSPSIINLYWQGKAFTSLIESAVTAIDLDRTRLQRTHGLLRGAERVANANTKLDRRAEHLAELAVVLALAGSKYQRLARTIAERAETVANSIAAAGSSAQALVNVAQVLIAAGKLDQAQDVALSITTRDAQAEALTALAAELIGSGEYARAAAVANHITNPYRQAETLTALAQSLATAGHLEKAEAIVSSIPDAGQLTEALVTLAGAVPPERARLLIARAFHAGDWTMPLSVLATIQPDVLAGVADKLLG